MIQLYDLRDLLEPLLELLNLLEMVAQLDDGRSLKHPVRVNDQLTMLKRVDVALDEEQVGAGLDGKEARARDVDPVRVPEMLDCGSSGGLELHQCQIQDANGRQVEQFTWMTACPSSVVLGLMMISSSMPSISMTRLRA